jgi:hypothetical protein
MGIILQRPIRADDYTKYPTLKDKMKEFNERVKEHVGALNKNLILQTEEDDPKEDVFEPTADCEMPISDQ